MTTYAVTANTVPNRGTVRMLGIEGEDLPEILRIFANAKDWSCVVIEPEARP